MGVFSFGGYVFGLDGARIWVAFVVWYICGVLVYKFVSSFVYRELCFWSVEGDCVG